MNKDRIKKLESVARELVTQFLFEELGEQSSEFGIITITDLIISSDLSYMDIYVSAFHNTEMLTKTLAKHAPAVQRKFNKSVDIRKFPRIRFRYDETGAVGDEVIRTLNDLNI